MSVTMEETMHRKAVIKAAEALAADVPISQARWAGNLLFISGQVGVDPKTGKLIGGKIINQVNQIMNNLNSILTSAEMGWNNVVKTTIYLTDMKDYDAVNKSYAHFFENCENFPSRVCIQVAALPLGAKVEIEAVAIQ